MKHKRRLSVIVILFIFLWSVFASLTGGTSPSKSSVQVWKNMDMYCTPYILDKNDFWYFKEELAELPYFERYSEILTEYANNLMNHPEKYAGRKLFDVKYAFVVTRKGRSDTLYADDSLKFWLIKPDGSNNYESYHADTSFTEKYDLHIPFFSNCW
ncbi:MAG: hypothetical protein GXO24_05280 [Chlorobi bacterium]|nr:hypothetical protein [Chlorobiota bacterium]